MCLIGLKTWHGRNSNLCASEQSEHQIPHRGDFLLLLKSQMNHTQMIDPRFEDEALSALMEEAFSQTEDETKFDVDAYFNSDIDY